MPEATTAAEPQTVSVSDDPETRKHLIVLQVCILKDRKAALTKLIEEKQAALRLLMKADGDRRRKTEDGTASFYTHPTFEVHDQAALAELFSKDTLVEVFKPTSAFVKAAHKAKLPIEKAITEGVDERFKVERCRTRAAREMQERVIEETKREAEARIERLARIMLADRQRLNTKGGNA